MARRAADYFAAEGRDFPWRRESNAYRLAVAEILLQRTQAISIVPTYLEIVVTHPDAQALAAADPTTVEQRLRPLGLSAKRASQLRRLGIALEGRGTDSLRDWRMAIKSIPGIGAYAARAIACFVFGERVGIVDSNVARIIRRVFGLRVTDPRTAIFQQYSDAIAVASPNPRASNFGLLDLGAAVCGRKPKCQECPFSAVCHYAKRNSRRSTPGYRGRNKGTWSPARGRSESAQRDGV
jgi:A/G-specific adenine glycosylase